MRKAKILTTGMYVPDYVVTNDLLAQAMDTSDEWITQRTGIKERRMIPDTYKMLQQLARAPDKEAYLRTLYDTGMDGKIDAEMSTADLALAATQVALQQANMTPQDLDLIIQTTRHPGLCLPRAGVYPGRQAGYHLHPNVQSESRLCRVYLCALPR